MDNLKDFFGGVFGFLAGLFWLAALVVLGWQSWGWLSAGEWNTITVGHAAVSVFGGMPMGGGVYGLVALQVLAGLSLALFFAVLGAVCNGLNKVFGG